MKQSNKIIYIKNKTKENGKKKKMITPMQCKNSHLFSDIQQKVKLNGKTHDLRKH